MRRITVVYASSFMERVNEMMRQFDVGWGHNDGAVETGVVTTTSALPLEEYAKIIEKAFAEADPGSRVYKVSEEKEVRL
jgi:hypothetical protein